jgi:hypothetical protein
MTKLVYRALVHGSQLAHMKLYELTEKTTLDPKNGAIELHLNNGDVFKLVVTKIPKIESLTLEGWSS